VHHEYRAPFALVTQYEHLLELMAVSVFSVGAPIAAGCHPLTQWAWLVVAIQLSVDAHTGYDFGLLDKMTSAWGGARHHDRHHTHPNTNFQPFFTWLDHAFGTAWKQKQCRD
jgi:sterol desaturase/sphingolipid hydroxylase (fatty acid hydroxylase superfamily)